MAILISPHDGDPKEACVCSLRMCVCRGMGRGGEKGPHANNGMRTVHQIAVVAVGLCLTLLLAGVLLLVQLCVSQNILLFFISNEW